MIKIQNRIRKKHFHFALAALAAAAIIMTAAIFVCGSFVNKIRNRVRSTSVQVISELTQNKARILNGLLVEAGTDIQTLAGVFSYINSQGEPFPAKLAEDFKEIHRTEAIAVIDKNGSYLYGSKKALAPNGMPEDFKADLKEHSHAMSNSVLCENCGRHILVGAEIPGGGEIYAAIPIRALQNACGKSTYGNEGYSYVVGRDGEIMIPPIRYGFEQFYGNIRAYLTDGGNDSQRIEAFMDALADRRSGSVVFSFEKKNQLICFEPLDVEKDWQIITTVPLSAVEKDGARIIQISACMAAIIVTFILIALSIGIFSYFYTRRRQMKNDLFLLNIYQAISENIDTVIFILDDKTDLLDYVFENSGRLLGIPSEEFLRNEKAEKQNCAFRTALLSLLQKERPDVPCEQELHTFNDRLNRDMWLKVLICPFCLGEIPKHIYAVTDITKAHLTQENIQAAVVAAEQANAAKSLFLANMSHDIRTPMNGIVGMTAIAKINLDNRERLLDCLNKIDFSSKLLLGLINEVLDMSKIESGKLVLSSEPFSLVQLFHGLEAVIRPQCEAKQQKLSVSMEVKHKKLSGDTVRLSQIFTNLLSNAIKFTPEGGEITIEITELEQRHSGFASCRFVITDTGIGMSPEFSAVIFTPFERADNTSVRKTEGTGLGMAITKNLVTSMGGQIFVESHEGEGSSFVVELELPVQEPDQSKKPSEEDSLTSDFEYKGRRFLLAEDNELNREIAVELLGEEGAVIETAQDGKEALESFLASPPGYYTAIFMDIQMPVMNGYEATRAIRASSHPQAVSIPVIAMTANAFAEDVKAAKDAGMNGHISKPIDMNVVSKVLLSLDGI